MTVTARSSQTVTEVCSHYGVLGVDLWVRSDLSEVHDSIQRDLAAFQCDRQFLDSGIKAELDVVSKDHSRRSLSSSIPPSATLLRVDFVRRSTLWGLDHHTWECLDNDLLIMCDYEKVRTSVWYSNSDNVIPIVRQELFMLLRNAFNSRGYMCLHAALAVTSDTKPASVLILGGKGAGKTSCMLLLMELGLKYGTDEFVIVRVGPELQVAGVPRRMGLSKDALESFFPRYCDTILRRSDVMVSSTQTKYLFSASDLGMGDHLGFAELAGIIIPVRHNSSEAGLTDNAPDEVRSAIWSSAQINLGDPNATYAWIKSVARRFRTVVCLIGNDVGANRKALAEALTRIGISGVR